MNKILRRSELCFCEVQDDPCFVNIWFTTDLEQTGYSWHKTPDGFINPPNIPDDEELNLFKIVINRCLEPVCMMLPGEMLDEDGNIVRQLEGVEPVESINRLKMTPWIRMKKHCIYSEISFASFLQEIRVFDGIVIKGVFSVKENKIEGVINYDDC